MQNAETESRWAIAPSEEKAAVPGADDAFGEAEDYKKELRRLQKQIAGIPEKLRRNGQAIRPSSRARQTRQGRRDAAAP